MKKKPIVFFDSFEDQEAYSLQASQAMSPAERLSAMRELKKKDEDDIIMFTLGERSLLGHVEFTNRIAGVLTKKHPYESSKSSSTV